MFTPLNATKTQRLMFEDDQVKVISGNLHERRRGKKAIVEIDGKRYEVHGKACGLPGCVCDAYIKEEEK